MKRLDHDPNEELRMLKMAGTYTVMITPFTADGRRVEEHVLRDFVDWQIEQGAAGLIPLGSTGEFLSLSDAERHSVAKAVIEQARRRVPVFVGASAENTWDVVKFCADAEMLGADGVLVCPPFYSTPSDEEIYQHYKLIGESIEIPIMIYNNPASANVDLLPDAVHRLSGIRNVRSIKDSTMDVTRVRDIVRLSGDRMTVFGGVMGYESFLNGAVGWTAVGSNLMPKEFSAMYDHCVTALDLDAARILYRRLYPVIELVGQARYVSATKAVLELMGWPVGPPRRPRLPLSGATLEWATRVAVEMGLIGQEKR